MTEKLETDKIKVINKKGGETTPALKTGDTIYMKDTRVRKAKEKPRYEKAKVIGEVEHNIVPVELKKRTTRVAIKNVKRPPQIVPGTSGTSSGDIHAGPSKPRTKSGDSIAKDGSSSEEE